MPSTSSLPKAVPWEVRHKSVYRTPGGFLSYLVSLRRICVIVDQHRPSKEGLISLLQSEFNDKRRHNSHILVNFLLRTNILKEEAGLCGVGCWTRRWLDNDDAGIVIALIHGRVRFVGEMLAELQETPRSKVELLSLANEKYGFAWKSPGQLDTRRGWLQAAGFIEIDHARELAVTEAGRAFLGRLGMAPAPPEPVPAPEPEPEPPDVDEAPFPNTPTRPHDLAAEIEESSTDSRDPNRFERAVRDAFAYLGLRAELLGGSGRTDVLLTARLGRSDTCKVTVDAKTAGSGRLGHVGRTPRKRGSGLLPAGWTRPERCAVVQPGEGSRGDGPFGPPSSRAMPTPRRGTAGTRRLPDPVHNPRRSRPHRDKGTSSRIPANARDRRRRLRGVGQEF